MKSSDEEKSTSSPKYKGVERRTSHWRVDKTINVWQVLTLLGLAASGVQWGDKQVERIAMLEHQISVQADRDREQDKTYDRQYQELKRYVDEVRQDIKTLLSRR
jgi:hypothetical protein